MAEGKIRVKFEAVGNEALIRAIKELNKQTKRLGLDTKKTAISTEKASGSTKRLGRNTDKLKGGLFGASNSLATARAKMLLYGFAVKQVIDFTKGLVDKSAQFEDISRGFNNLRMSAGMSAETFDKLNTALDGTVSSIDLMQQANNAMLLGIFKTEDEMANMFDVAQRLAQVLGKDATFGIESLVTGLGRQSKLMLDNLGIVFSAEKAYVDYANALKKNVGDLTDSERKQAFLNKAMESANELVANAGDEYLGTSSSLAQLSTSFVNARIELGEALTPAILASVDALASMLDNMDSGRIKRWGVAIGGAYTAFKLYNLAIRIAKIETISFQAIFSKTGWGAAIALIGIASGLMMEYFGIFDEGTDILEDGNEELAENNRLLKENEEALEATMKMQREGAVELQKQLDLLNATTKTEKMLINLGHEASIFESRLIGSIISKNLLLEQMDEAKKNRIESEKKERDILASTVTLRQQEQLLFAKVNGSSSEELELMKAKIDFDNQLLTIGSKMNGVLIEKVNRTRNLTAGEMEFLVVSQEIYRLTVDLIKQNYALDKSYIEQFQTESKLSDNIIANITARATSLRLSIEEKNLRETYKKDDPALASLIDELELKKSLLAIHPDLLAQYESILTHHTGTEPEMMGVIGALKAEIKLKRELNEETKKSPKLWQDEAVAAANSVGMIGRAITSMARKNKDTAILGLRISAGSAIASGIAGAAKSFEKEGTLGFITGTALLVQTMARVQAINAQIRALQGEKFEQGGLVGGRRHSQGGTMIEAEQGEFVMSRNAVNSIGVESLNRMNQGSSGGGSSISININGGMISPDFVENELAESVREAVRRGADFGIS